MEKFDYIVVGGGSAGCVVAGRLVRESNARVLLLEAGYSHHNALLDMPPGIFKLIGGSKFITHYRTTQQQQLDGRTHEIPQANVLGGGSTVNAQVYMRGRPSDYEGWNAALKDTNDLLPWDWKAVLPHFVQAESNERLQSELHGVDGPILVSDPGYVDEFSKWFVQSVQALGEPFNHDFNGVTQRGVGYYQFTNRKGRRSSAAYAYIEPNQTNKRLTVRLESTVTKLLMDNDRCIGVEYRDASGNRKEAFVDHEVILSAGVFVTPKILVHSGIGDERELKTLGIRCVNRLPGVGKNLIDHPEVPITGIASGPYGYFKQGSGWRMLLNGLQLKMFGSGRVLSSGVEAGALVNPERPTEEPTIQAFCVPIVYHDRDSDTSPPDTYGLTVTTVVLKPRSRGSVKVVSPDPLVKPAVSPNLLGDPDDMREMLEGQRFFIRAFQQKPLVSKIKYVALPSPDDLSDEALKKHCKKNVKTNFHPVGTAKMGSDNDGDAVLDSWLRVRGTRGLRVCDASAFPDITAGNTNAAALMLGSRCAEILLNEYAGR